MFVVSSAFHFQSTQIADVPNLIALFSSKNDESLTDLDS